VGGGTPSLLTPRQWKEVFRCLETAFDLSCADEQTVEANPESLTREHLDLWKDAGVTRISIGVQSLDDGDLDVLHRPHTVADAERAIEMSLEEGFQVSADLMFGLPGQTMKTWMSTLSGAARMRVEHLSLYQLSFEPGSAWGKESHPSIEGYPFYRWAQYYLERKGFTQYEIASWARNGKWCVHNAGYWRNRTVVGLGPSAWGYDHGTRYRNHATLDSYRDALQNGMSPVDWTETLSPDERAREEAILALRTRWGVASDSFILRHGRRAWAEIREILAGLPQKYFDFPPGRICLNNGGMRVANSIWEKLLA